ncbi:MAG: protein kinase [Myxococcota bacterium]
MSGPPAGLPVVTELFLNDPNALRAPSNALPTAGDRIGRYEVIAPIGQGGMAAIFAVRLTSLGGFDKLFAMKVLLPHLRSDAEFADMFLDEARIAASIQHPNVVQVLDVGTFEGGPYMIMELLRGQSLSAIVERVAAQNDRVPDGLILHALGMAGEGLAAAHATTDGHGRRLGVVHRDVSPQNIHVGYDGRINVLDFGIASARGRLTKTRTGKIKGKLHYLAPEQVRGSKSADHRVDVWALAVVAWEQLTGQRLFKADEDGTTLWNVMQGEIPSLASLRPDLPAALHEALAAALERNPHRRTRYIQDLAGVLLESGSERGRSDLAGYVSSLYAAEQTAEDERLAAATSPAREVSVPEEPNPLSETRTVIDPPASRPARRWVAWAAVALGGLVTAGAISLLAEDNAPPVAVPVEAASPSPSLAKPTATPNEEEPSAPPDLEAASSRQVVEEETVIEEEMAVEEEPVVEEELAVEEGPVVEDSVPPRTRTRDRRPRRRDGSMAGGMAVAPMIVGTSPYQ